MLSLCATVVAQAYELPKNAQDFIDNHFAGIEVLTIDHKRGYNVTLDDFTQLEFNKDGIVIEIHAEHAENALPASLLPQKVKDLIARKWPTAKVLVLENDKKYSMIKLNNNIEIKYKSDGTLLDIEL